MVTTGLLLVVALALLSLWFIHFYVNRRRLYKLASEFDGPPCLPIIGNALACIQPITEMADSIMRGSLKYKSPTRLWFGPFLFVSVWNPEDVKTILNSSRGLSKVPYLYKMTEVVMGRGLVTVPAEEWKHRRRFINPNFNQNNLNSFFGVFITNAKALVDELKVQDGKGAFDVVDCVSKYALRNILETVLGFKESEGDAVQARDITEWLHVVLAALVLKMSNVLYFSDFLFRMSSVGKQLEEGRKKFQLVMNSLIEKWKTQSLQNHLDSAEYAGDLASRPKTFVEHLVLTCDQAVQLTPEELHNEVNTMIITGFETTASMLSYLLVLLGMHPDIQERAYREVRKVLGRKSDLELEDLNNFTYLDRVIKECLRVFPIMAGFARYNDQEIQLENHTIPARTNIIISLIGLHRDPTLWPNPTKFDPDRFFPEEEAKRHPYSWIPFSAGPRNCIGHRYAMMALRILSSYVLLNYKISTPYRSVEDVQLSMFILLKPTKGYTISLTAR